jgi:hypothetical protein
VTKRQRAQVVELLKCAADFRKPWSINGLSDARDAIGVDFSAFLTAMDATASVAPGFVTYADMHAGLLEAAARVELGEWP